MKEKYAQIKGLTKDRQVIYSFLIAVILSVVGYYTNNWPIFTGENLTAYTVMGIVERYLGVEDDYPDALFVNTSWDNQLIDIEDDGEVTVGNTQITDRRKLLKFLQLLEHTDYEYIVIDIGFAEKWAQKDSIGRQIDTELFEKIKSMDRCVVATLKNMNLLGGLDSKAALAEYKATLMNTNFVRYQYFDSIPLIPLRVYNEIRKEQRADTISYRHSPYIYNEGFRLCQNSLFLKFSSSDFKKVKSIQKVGEYYISEKYNYKDLGHDYVDHIVQGCTEDEVLEMLVGDMKAACSDDGKRPIVFIGNVQDDVHETYAGKQPGVVILYKAIRALQEGKHLVNPVRIVLLFLVYFILCLFILKDKSILDLIPRRIRQKHSLWVFLCQLATMSAVLFIVDIIFIKFYGVTTNFIVATILFGTLKLYVEFKKFQYNEKNN